MAFRLITARLPSEVYHALKKEAEEASEVEKERVSFSEILRRKLDELMRGEAP